MAILPSPNEVWKHSTTNHDLEVLKIIDDIVIYWDRDYKKSGQMPILNFANTHHPKSPKTLKVHIYKCGDCPFCEITICKKLRDNVNPKLSPPENCPL